jgi:hypothetical protein
MKSDVGIATYRELIGFARQFPADRLIKACKLLCEQTSQQFLHSRHINGSCAASSVCCIQSIEVRAAVIDDLVWYGRRAG